MRTLLRIAIGAGAVSAATVLGAATASASPGHAATGTHRVTGTHHTNSGHHPAPGHAATRHVATRHVATHRPVTRQTARHRTAVPGTHYGAARTTRSSANWAGYSQGAAAVRRPVTSVSGTWHVPTATQHARGAAEMAADWIGVGGACADTGCRRTDTSLVQAGVTTTIGRSGHASYSSWFETLPHGAQNVPLRIRPGDVMSVEIGRIAADRWQVRMADTTTGHAWSTAVRYHSGMGSADWVSERPTLGGGPGARLAPLPDRTATSFRNTRVNGTRAHLSAGQAIVMSDRGTRLATPSTPESGGNGFSVCTHSTTCGAGR